MKRKHNVMLLLHNMAASIEIRSQTFVVTLSASPALLSWLIAVAVSDLWFWLSRLVWHDGASWLSFTAKHWFCSRPRLHSFTKQKHEEQVEFESRQKRLIAASWGIFDFFDDGGGNLVLPSKQVIRLHTAHVCQTRSTSFVKEQLHLQQNVLQEKTVWKASRPPGDCRTTLSQFNLMMTQGLRCSVELF